MTSHRGDRLDAATHAGLPLDKTLTDHDTGEGRSDGRALTRLRIRSRFKMSASK